MTQSLVVGVDIDDVMYGWYETAHALCVEEGITNGITPTTWSPHEEYGCPVDDWLAVMDKHTLSGRMYMQEPPIPGAVEALHKLKAAGHSIFLVTARGFFQHGSVIKSQTVRWLNTWDVPHDGLAFVRDKTLVRTDVFVDDSPKNVAALVAAGIPTLMVNAQHSRDYVYPEGSCASLNCSGANHRVDSLAEAVERILKGDY
jgi:hypothetical protein